MTQSLNNIWAFAACLRKIQHHNTTISQTDVKMSTILKRPNKPLTSLFFTMLLLTSMLFPALLKAEASTVLATLKPIHSLLSALMLDIDTPELLLDNRQSPHNYNMKPSDRRQLDQSDLIIYISEDIESFIPAIQHSLADKNIVKLTDIPGLKLLTTRAFDSHNKNHQEQIDGHIWLSIDNAITISQYLSQLLIKRDRINTLKYQINTNKLVIELKQLQNEIKLKLKPFSNHAYILFHDAFQYFEDEYMLNAGLFVTNEPDHKAGIRHISFLKQQIHQHNIRCIFYEPPNIPKIITTLTENRAAQIIALDPIGSEFPPGHRQYFNLLNNIATKMQNCLKQDL